MPALMAANLLSLAMAAQGSAQAATNENAPVDATPWVEYQLAAIAQPGDALSDYVLANGLSMQLSHVPDAVVTIPGPLRQHMTAERDRLMARADAALMDDPVQLSMRLSCHENAPEREHCDARRQRLAELDPDNAYTALALMSAAWSQKDDAGFFEAAALGASASRYEPVLPAVFASLRRRFEAIPDVAVPGMPRQPEGMPVEGVTAMSMTAAVALPAYQRFSAPCRNSEGELRVHCRAIARRMLESEGSALDVYIGASVLQAVGEPAEQARAEERRREVDWLQQHAVTLMSDTETSAILDMDEYFRLYGEQGELPAVRHALKANGIAVMPPADWTSGRPTP